MSSQPANLLREEMIESILKIEKQGAKGFLKHQTMAFFSTSTEHLEAIEQASNQEDWQELRHQVHKLCGFAGTLGCVKLVDLCKDIEKKIDEDESAEANKSVPLLKDTLYDTHQALKNWMKKHYDEGM